MNLLLILLPGNHNKGSGSIFSINSPLSCLTPKKKEPSCSPHGGCVLQLHDHLVDFFLDSSFFKLFLCWVTQTCRIVDVGWVKRRSCFPWWVGYHSFTVLLWVQPMGARVQCWNLLASRLSMVPISAADPSPWNSSEPSPAQGFVPVLQEFHEAPLVSLARSFPSALLRVVPSADLVRGLCVSAPRHPLKRVRSQGRFLRDSMASE